MPRMLNGSGVYPKDADALSHFKSHSQSLLPAACDSCPDPEESPLDGKHEGHDIAGDQWRFRRGGGIFKGILNWIYGLS